MSRNLSAYEKASFKLLADLDEASQQYGWQIDQGYGSAVDRATEARKVALAAMTKRLQQLHTVRRRLEKAERYIRENPA